MKEVDEYIDLVEALEKVELTELQHTALLLWLAGHTHSEIARIMGTKRPAVTRLLGRATKKIAELM